MAKASLVVTKLESSSPVHVDGKQQEEAQEREDHNDSTAARWGQGDPGASGQNPVLGIVCP